MKRQSHSQTRILQRLPQERGWTLIELLIGATMMLAVVFAALPIIDGAATTGGRIQTAALSIGDARNFSDQILRDLRPTYFVVTTPTTKRLTVDTYVRTPDCGSGTPLPSDQDGSQSQCRVTYICAVDSCTRQESAVPPATGGGPPVTLVSGLSSDDVFSWVINGDAVDFVGIRLEIPNQPDVGGDAITLQDGTALRNVGTL